MTKAEICEWEAELRALIEIGGARSLISDGRVDAEEEKWRTHMLAALREITSLAVQSLDNARLQL